ncbi:hypothetical protein [Streptomyces sp. NPDC001978]|uniref:hypothetical protein n=1 Tax=Streptomyces sp. NPDC001978 TaxID=3364627 RepID=UPI0036B5E2BA
MAALPVAERPAQAEALRGALVEAGPAWVVIRPGTYTSLAWPGPGRTAAAAAARTRPALEPALCPGGQDELRALAAPRRLSVDDHMITAPRLQGSYRLVVVPTLRDLGG